MRNRLLARFQSRPDASPLDKQHWRVILVLVVGVFLPLLDATIVNIAVREIGLDLSAPLSSVQWVIAAYTLAAAATVPVSGWAANRFGAARMWIAGLAGFMTASLLAGIAWSAAVLVAFRVLQGIGAGLMMPVMQTVLVRCVGQHNAKAAMARMAVPSVIAPILGPLVGGLILHHAGWRCIFLLNVPIGLVAICLALAHLPPDEKAPTVPFDVGGFLLLCPGMSLIVHGLSRAGETDPANVARGAWCALLGFGLSAAFVVRARRRAGRPLIDVALFDLPSFRASAGLLFLSSLAFHGGLLLLAVYFLGPCGFGLLATGALLALQGIGTMASRQQLEAGSRRFGTGGLALAATGLTAIGSAPLLWPGSTAHWVLLAACMLTRGAGLGLLTIIALSTAYRDVVRERIADASALTRIITNLAASMGAASVLAALRHRVETSFATLAGPGGFTAAFAFMLVISIACAWPAARLRETEPTANRGSG